MKNLARNFLNSKLLMITFIILAGFTAYSFMLSGTFKHMDDNFSIVDNQDIKSFANIGKIFQKPFFDEPYYYRPLVSFSFMVEYYFFDLNPLFYNLTNLFLHLASAVCIFFIINLIFRSLAISFFVALLFAIHPIHWEAVSNIPGRAIVLCAFFYLIAFLLYILGKAKQNAGFFFLSFASFMLALLSKETAITFPVMLCSYEYFVGRKDRKWFFPALGRVLPFVVLAAGYLVLRRALGMNMFHWRYPSEAILGVMTFLRELISYFRIFIFPTDLHFDRARLVFNSFWDIELLLTALFFLLLFCTLVAYRKKLSREFLFFTTWIFIELLPVSQIIPIGIQYAYISTAEHFFYTASLGIFVVTVLFFYRAYGLLTSRGLVSRGVFAIFIFGLFIYFFLITIQQNIYSSNELAMLKRSTEYNKKNARIQTVLGLSYVKKRMFKEAEECFRKTLIVEPFNAAARIALGKSLCDQGRFFEGIKEYERVENPGKYEKLLKENLRFAYAIVIDQYKEMITKDPDNAAAHYSLGVMYAKAGKTQEAIAQYHRVLQLQPDFKNALFNLASSLEATGRLKEAREFYEKFLTLGPDDKYLVYHANNHLGLIYEKLGDPAKSKEYFQKSSALEPPPGKK